MAEVTFVTSERRADGVVVERRRLVATKRTEGACTGEAPFFEPGPGKATFIGR